MPRRFIIGASLILLAIAAGGVYLWNKPMEPAITPEQARAALLKLGRLRVITGGEGDPIAVNLRSGAIAWTDASRLTIGRFFSCNLREKTWQMAFSNGRTGTARTFPRVRMAGLNGNPTARVWL